MNADHRAADLHHDLRVLEKLSSDSLRAMADTQKEISQVRAKALFKSSTLKIKNKS